MGARGTGEGLFGELWEDAGKEGGCVQGSCVWESCGRAVWRSCTCVGELWQSCLAELYMCGGAVGGAVWGELQLRGAVGELCGRLWEAVALICGGRVWGSCVIKLCGGAVHVWGSCMERAAWRVVWGDVWGELKLRGAVGGCASDV